MSLSLALESALGKQVWNDLDAAAIQLARRYAWDIDEAELVSVTADKLLREVQGWMDPAIYDRFKALLARIERTQVLAQLGPKLLLTMAELGMTPKSRADVTGRGSAPDGSKPAGPAASALAEQRAKRAARLKRAAGGVDPS